MSSLDGGEQPVHQEEMSKEQRRVVQKRSFLGETDSLAGAWLRVQW
jgi:hypothetical protein